MKHCAVMKEPAAHWGSADFVEKVEKQTARVLRKQKTGTEKVIVAYGVPPNCPDNIILTLPWFSQHTKWVVDTGERLKALLQEMDLKAKALNN